MNTIKDGLLDPTIDYESLQPKPINEPPNEIDDDLEDIQIKPTKPTTSRPMKVTTKPPRPITTTSPFKEERYKVVCYYTNWAWYR